MKKIFRSTAVILAVVLIAFSLCSCRKLDSMREHQAFYNSVDKSEILLGGNIYKAVNNGNRELMFTNSFDYSYYVTTKDVPVLLSNLEGDNLDVNEDLTVIKKNIYNYAKWYVREDVYDKYMAALTEAALDRYFLSYDEYPDSGRVEFRVRHQNILLDEETAEAINKLLSIPDNNKVSYKELSDGDYAHRIIYLQKCDKDMLVTDGSSEVSVINDNGKFYVCSGRTYDEESILCPVTDDDKELISKLFENYPDSIDTYNFKYNFEPDPSYGKYHDDDVYRAPAVTEAADSNTV
ncbi:MAG: hypothetical protein IJI48_04605 [Ruminococcus sp.]|nr:hypothetical protein [Ruminococcus sp.]